MRFDAQNVLSFGRVVGIGFFTFAASLGFQQQTSALNLGKSYHCLQYLKALGNRAQCNGLYMSISRQGNQPSRPQSFSNENHLNTPTVNRNKITLSGGILINTTLILIVAACIRFFSMESAFTSTLTTLTSVFKNISGVLSNLDSIPEFISTKFGLLSNIASLPWQATYIGFPLLIGFFGMMINKLVVQLIFSPLRSVQQQTVEVINNVRMKNKMNSQSKSFYNWINTARQKHDLLVQEMLDINKIFSRIDTDRLTAMMAPKLEPIIDKIIANDVRLVRATKRIPGVPIFYNTILRLRTEVIVRNIISKIKKQPTLYISFQDMIASDNSLQDEIIDGLYQRCEKFIMMSGLLGG